MTVRGNMARKRAGGEAKPGPKAQVLPAYRYHLSPMGVLFKVSEEQPVVPRVLGACFVLLTAFLILSWGWVPFQPAPVFGIISLTLFTLGALYLYVWLIKSRQSMVPKNLYLLGFVLLISMVISRFLLVILHAMNQTFPFIPAASLDFTIPVALGSVLLAVLFNPRVAFGGALCLSLLVTMMVSRDFSFFLYALVGAIAGVFAIPATQDRASLFQAGCWVAVANVYTVVTFFLIRGVAATLPYDLVASLANGLLVALFATTLLPLLEYLFETATDLKLLELSNMNQPLLKQLMVNAPGTYHHSLMVGTLAEAGAEAVGANTLLCRVGAYYHDVGKLKKPAYFIENQMDAMNPHDKLSPSLSSLIVTSHVKDGIEMALEHRIPPALVDLIPQHHGTRLVTFFYEKAKESQDPELAEVKEEDYRYPGPKPQTKEAAILMFADAVEAAARTLAEPTPARIQGLVQRLVNTIFVEGQLSECDLTLKDLHQITRAFVRVLTAVHHHRVDYPGFRFQEGKKKNGERDKKGNGDSGPKPTKEEKDRPPMAKKDGAEDIKRLGQTEG